MADKLLLVTMFIVLTLPGIGLANQLPIWFTILVISRDVAIVATVAVVNLAVGPRTFRPSIFEGCDRYIVTGIVTLSLQLPRAEDADRRGIRLRVAGHHAGISVSLPDTGVRIGQSQARFPTRGFQPRPAPGSSPASFSPFFEADLRLPFPGGPRPRDVGLPDLGIVLGQGPVDQLALRSGESDDRLRDVLDRHLVRVADVDRLVDVGFHQPDDAVDQIADVAEAAGLLSAAEDRDVLATPAT